MSNTLCLTIRFLISEPAFHGKRDGAEPEWPPSPLRLFQALVDAAESSWRHQQCADAVKPMLNWFEELSPSVIITPNHRVGIPYRIAVPNNDWDSPARVWAKGGEPVKPHRPIDLRTMKTVMPIRLVCVNSEDNALRYLYDLPSGDCPHMDALTRAVRSITHLGWGIDMAAGDATILTDAQAIQLKTKGYCWKPDFAGGTPLRAPIAGTLDDLTRKHADYLGRVTENGFRPVPPLRVFRIVRYRRHDQLVQRPYRVFELRKTDGERFRYPHRRLIHIAGMVRHLALKITPPGDAPATWAEFFVAGHATGDSPGHRQLSYLPLPSIGHAHVDPGVRRVMIVAPRGDEAWLDHVARRLAGQILEPSRGEEFRGEPPLLVPVRRDNIARFYTQPANAWASFTPVILPGHDDHKPGKTLKLIEKALAQSDIEQPCEFEWSAYSRWPKSYSAHKYDRNKRPTGYIRPDHLLSQTAVHLTLRFRDGLRVPGPIVIGAGRHCGFGLMAAIDD